MSEDRLELAAALAESEVMQGGLGAIAYGVLKGLHAGGASEEILGSVRLLMQEHFQRLSDGDCNTVCEVVFQRLKRDADKDSWY